MGVILYQNLNEETAVKGETRLTNSQCLSAGGVISNDKCFLIPDVALEHSEGALVGYSWGASDDACLSEFGGRLATPIDQLENDDLWELVNDKASAAEITWSYYWIGYTDQSTEGAYVDTEGVDQQFVNYVAGEPLRLNDNDCIGIARSGDSGVRAETGKMQELACGAKYIFACQAYLAEIPSQPRNVAATALAEGGGAQITFTDPETDGGKTIDNCTARAFREDVNDGLNHVADVTTTTNTAEIAGLEVGVEYTFDVLCTNEVGSSYPSARTSPVMVLSVAPSAVTALTVTAGLGSAFMTFDPPAQDGGSPVTHYYVTASGGVALEFTAAEATPYLVVTGLTNGDSYTFTVKAGNDAYTRNGNDVDYLSPGTTAASAVTPTTARPAAVVETPVAEDGLARSSKVTFTESTTTGLDGYVITCHPACPAQGTQAYSASGIDVTGLDAAVDYVFFVQAVKSGDVSAPSEPSNSVTPIPDTPTAPGTPVASKYGRGATVTWTAPSDNGGADITSYTVDTHLDGSISSAQRDTVSGDVTTAIVRGLTLGQDYVFIVSATNSQGPGADSAESNVVTPDEREPDIPVGPVAITTRTVEEGGRGYHVAFTVPADPSDCGAAADCAINGIVITATDDDGITYESSVATTGGAAFDEEIEDIRLAVGSNITVKVQAVNPVGRSDYSGMSNEVQVESGAPSEVTNLVLTGNNGLVVTIDYDAPTDDGGVPFDGVFAELVVTSGTGRSTRHTDSAASGNTFEFAGTGDFCPGGTDTTCDPITIRVIAVNSVGSRSSGTEAQVTCAPTAPVTPPAPVVTGRSAGFKITFVDPVFDGAADITNWEYQYKEVNATDWTDATSVTYTSKKTKSIDETVDRIFHARVRCTNPIGTTQWSPVSGNVTAGQVPAEATDNTGLIASMAGILVAFCALAGVLLYCKFKDIWCFAWTDKC